MTTNSANQQAQIIAYYLARFNSVGLGNLGYTSFNQAFSEIAAKLGVKKNYIKLTRDEFDPVFEWREGWKRKMSPQILKVIDLFKDLEEEDVRELVMDLLGSKNNQSEGDVDEIVNILQYDSSEAMKKKGTFVLRGPTGRQAEDFFIVHHKENRIQPTNPYCVDGLSDRRVNRSDSGTPTSYLEAVGRGLFVCETGSFRIHL